MSESEVKTESEVVEKRKLKKVRAKPVLTDETETPKLTYLDKLIDYLKLKPTDKLVSKIKAFEEKQNEIRSANSTVLQFGKYKGKTFKDLVSFDKKYLQWLVKQDWMAERSEYEHIKSILA